MRRWPLSTAAFLLVLAAHLAIALAGEPQRLPRPVVTRGRIALAASYAGDFGYDLVVGERYLRYPLMPTSDAHVRAIHANARRPREVEVVGDLSVLDGRCYIAIETIKELP
jgi:hypothetical protein